MTLRRWLALSGVGAAVLFVASVFVQGGTPNDDARASEVVSYFRDHQGGAIASALIGTLAAVLLVLFAVRLREVLVGDGSGDALLPNAALGGALILATGSLLDSAVIFALQRAAHFRLAGPAQTLNVVSNDDFFVLIGGIAILLLAAGIATVRQPVLPRWLGWAAIGIGVLSLLGPLGVFGALLSIVWLLVVSILIFRRDRVAASARSGT
jgi:hypothetical protein